MGFQLFTLQRVDSGTLALPLGVVRHHFPQKIANKTVGETILGILDRKIGDYIDSK